MQDIKEQIQAMLDEISSAEGTPRFDLSEDDGCTASFGEGMMVRVQLRPHIPELDFTVPLGSVPEERRAAVYGALLASNFYWAETHGATLALEPETEQILLQYQENALTLTKERLQKTMEGFFSVAEEWKDRLDELIVEPDTTDETPVPPDGDSSEGGDASVVIEP